ncbi:MAG TPA: hypothetical protein VKW06_21595 [Candidatus Angelobacter sp.]|nr:hypothetical protein [Candidatus Angelobacter sp.]
MRLRTIIVPLLAPVFSLVVFAQDQLEKARVLYLNKDVVITDTVFRTASEQDGRFRISERSLWLPTSYQGQTATVIAVQPKEAFQPQAAKVNALGETVTPADAGGEIEFVVRFKDGTVAMRRDSLQTIKNSMLLPEEVAGREALSRASESKTQQLLGRSVYASALSRIYRPDVTLAEMQDKNQITVPLLVPLRITAAKWNPGTGCAIIKVDLPGGSSGLSLLSLEQESNCGYTSILKEIPAFLSQDEIKAIQQHAILKGMTMLALYYSVGIPDRQNDWGRNGKQLVYKSGLTVYTDTTDKVTDWYQLSSTR